MWAGLLRVLGLVIAAALTVGVIIWVRKPLEALLARLVKD